MKRVNIKAIQKETTDIKTVVVLSDGGGDTCWQYQICDMTDEWIPFRTEQLEQADLVRTRLISIRFKEKKFEKSHGSKYIQIRKDGVQFIYVAVGEMANPKHWRYKTTRLDIIAIAGGEENVIFAGEYKVRVFDTPLKHSKERE